MPTIAEFVRAELLLTAHCTRSGCGHAARINPADLAERGLGGRQLASVRGRCSRCGGDQVTWTVHSREQIRISRRHEQTSPGEWLDEWWREPSDEHPGTPQKSTS